MERIILLTFMAPLLLGMGVLVWLLVYHIWTGKM